MIRYLLFLAFPLSAYSQECPSIASICNDYGEVEYVLVGRGDTTAVISKANVAADLGLSNPVETRSDDDGQYTVYHEKCFSIIFLELFDGREVTTISRL
jgi:hypothetical protein